MMTITLKLKSRKQIRKQWKAIDRMLASGVAVRIVQKKSDLPLAGHRYRKAA